MTSVALAVALTFWVLRFTRRLWPPGGAHTEVRVLGTYSPVLSWIKYQRLRLAGRFAVRQWWLALPRASLLELTLVTLWAVWVGRVYLNFDPMRWLPGGDWALNLEGYFPWTWLAECGTCVLWNGSLNGGAPAFVELVAAVLHPVWIVAITLFGVVNASKVAVIAGLAMAGWAQWWLAKSLRLGLVARLWSAGLIVVGGHLAGRLDNGLVEELFPLGAASLAMAAGLDLALTGRRRAVALFGVLLGLSMLSGQAYMQVGLVACLLPCLAVFAFTGRGQRRPVLRSLLVAAGIGLLISSVLWVPLLHFWPNFSKPTSDPTWVDMQSLELLVLNLVIADRGFYEALRAAGLPGSPAWFANYIGWVPLLLAVVGLRAAPRRWLRVVAFAVGGTVLVYLVGSAVLLKWLVPVVPGAVLSLRTPSVMTGLAVPLIVWLAAMGVDALWRLRWPQVVLRLDTPLGPALSLRWLLLVPLLWSVRSAHQAAQQYMALVEAPVPFYSLIGSTGLAGRQWVSVPFGESELVVVALQSGLKVTDVVRPWFWKEQGLPAKHLEFTRQATDGDRQVPVLGLYTYTYPDSYYARVQNDTSIQPCDARAVGGHITVTCTTAAAGELVVLENAWSGWRVWRDGRPARLRPGQWLSTDAPAGEHRFEFRYFPWDVPLGVGLSLVGVGWAAWLWRRPRRRMVLART